MIPKRQTTLDISNRLAFFHERRKANARPTKDYARKRRWLYSERPDMAVLAHTRSEAVGWFKQQLGVEIDHSKIVGEIV